MAELETWHKWCPETMAVSGETETMHDGEPRPATATGPTVRAELAGTEGRVALSGEIDHDAAPQLASALDELIKAGAQRLVVDFAHLSFFDSACISALVRAHEEVSQRGGTVRLVNVDRFARRVLQIAGLLPLFEVEPADESGTS